MSLRAQLEKFNTRAARFGNDCFGANGCLLGATVAVAVSVEAIIPTRAQKQATGEGGLEFIQAPTAIVIKIDGLTPKQDWVFFDAEKWWLVDDVITSDQSAEWKLILKPLSNTPS